MTARLPAQLCQPGPARDPGPTVERERQRERERRGVRRVSVAGQEGRGGRRGEARAFGGPLLGSARAGVMAPASTPELRGRAGGSGTSQPAQLGSELQDDFAEV